MARFFEQWKKRAIQLKLEVYAIYLAYRDPRVPWYARVFAACVVGYAFSPIDLIPDPIPILGYLDDLILIPLGVKAALSMIPECVMAESREKAQKVMPMPINRVAAGIVIAIWLLLAGFVIVIMLRAFKG